MISSRSICPCQNSSIATPPPSFVGGDYFCDTGFSGNNNAMELNFYPYLLWDGTGCIPSNQCCSFNNPPWFYKQLPTSTSGDIEMRVCRDELRSDEDVATGVVEIYVQ